MEEMFKQAEDVLAGKGAAAVSKDTILEEIGKLGEKGTYDDLLQGMDLGRLPSMDAIDDLLERALKFKRQDPDTVAALMKAKQDLIQLEKLLREADDILHDRGTLAVARNTIIKEIQKIAGKDAYADILQGADLDSLPSMEVMNELLAQAIDCLLYTSPSPRDRQKSRMPSSA